MADRIPSNQLTQQRSAEDTPTVAAPLQTDAPLEFVPGAVIANRYRIVSKLGKGGMGEVYRARDRTSGRRVQRLLDGLFEC